MPHLKDVPLGTKKVTPDPLLSVKLGEVLDDRLPLSPLLHQALTSLPRALHDHDFLQKRSFVPCFRSFVDSFRNFPFIRSKTISFTRSMIFVNSFDPFNSCNLRFGIFVRSFVRSVISFTSRSKRFRSHVP